MTRILGIDPGMATMGFGCIDATDTAITPVDFGIISTPPKQPVGDRLFTLYSDLSELLATLQPEWLGLEKFFFYRMGNTIQVAQARGVILLALRHYSPLEPQEFTPAQIKQTLTGYGNADKQAVQAAVVRDLHLERPPQPDDAADGLAIALTVWHHRHTRKI